MESRTEYAQRRLRDLGDPERAPAMAAYMKTTDPFYGVPAPARRVVLRELRTRFPVTTHTEYCRAVRDLWRLPHREERYLAVDIATTSHRFISFDAMDLYRTMIVEGAWWDFVDELAIRCVGRVWRDDPDRTLAIMREWIDDENMWLRRTALIGQIKHRAGTDEATLFEFCVARAHEREFFIRKAIGWALREYAKTSPRAVADFALEHRDVLSGLSFREATRHIDLG